MWLKIGNGTQTKSLGVVFCILHCISIYTFCKNKSMRQNCMLLCAGKKKKFGPPNSSKERVDPFPDSTRKVTRHYYWLSSQRLPKTPKKVCEVPGLQQGQEVAQ